jgi:hypothetical protein
MPYREAMIAEYDTVEPWEEGQLREEVITLACRSNNFPTSLQQAYTRAGVEGGTWDAAKGTEGIHERLDLVRP